MQLSVSWLRDFVDGDATPEAIAAALTARGFTVDSVTPQPMPAKIVVGLIDSLARHPNADRLQVSTVDVGGSKLQIVTGATNVAVGDKIPIALVGAVVFARELAPDGSRKMNPIAKSTLRGMESVGMMCSASELALPGEYDDGIVILDTDAVVGEDFWHSVRFGDAVLDVDVPSNRPDCLSVLGLAREAGAGLGAPFRALELETFAGTAAPGIGVEIGDKAICRRLEGQRFTGARSGRTPFWMALRLQASRVRSLGFLVDVSNYVQLETGQPLHFYDATALRGGRIVARASTAGEKVVTLDGVERTLAAGVPVIADGEGLVGIAGIFGGARAAVTDTTTDVFLESPNFVGAPVRRAAIALGLRTEGASRHEKNLPLELVELGRRRAAQFLTAAGATASAVVEAGESPGAARVVTARPARINGLLGTSYDVARMRAALAPIGLAAAGDDPLRVAVPYWRNDVAEEVDIVEEVARAIGYDDIEERRIAATPQDVDEGQYRQESVLAQTLVALGYREAVTIALQGSKVVAAWERSGLPFWPELATITNPLSEDQRFLRPSLLPGLLTVATRNWERATGPVRLFEVGHVFRPLGSDTNSGSPDAGAYDENGVLEWPSLCGLAMFPSDAAADANPVDRRLLEVKGEAERAIASLCDLQVTTEPGARGYFHAGAAANLIADGRTLAKFGRIHPQLARAYDLPSATYAFLLYLENIPQRRPIVKYVPLPKFPGTTRDIAVVVDEKVTARELADAATADGLGLLERVAAFDEYRGAQVGAGKKSVALSIALRKPDATITDVEADAAIEKIVAGLRERFQADLRGPA
ncbi:MAG TPA: phenylalanine--tRNA ligase subunit beta [Candidatus Eremiobacteraceae bacterium]